MSELDTIEPAERPGRGRRQGPGRRHAKAFLGLKAGDPESGEIRRIQPGFA